MSNLKFATNTSACYGAENKDWHSSAEISTSAADGMSTSVHNETHPAHFDFHRSDKSSSFFIPRYQRQKQSNAKVAGIKIRYVFFTKESDAARWQEYTNDQRLHYLFHLLLNAKLLSINLDEKYLNAPDFRSWHSKLFCYGTAVEVSPRQPGSLSVNVTFGVQTRKLYKNWCHLPWPVPTKETARSAEQCSERPRKHMNPPMAILTQLPDCEPQKSPLSRWDEPFLGDFSTKNTTVVRSVLGWVGEEIHDPPGWWRGALDFQSGGLQKHSYTNLTRPEWLPHRTPPDPLLSSITAFLHFHSLSPVFCTIRTSVCIWTLPCISLCVFVQATNTNTPSLIKAAHTQRSFPWISGIYLLIHNVPHLSRVTS